MHVGVREPLMVSRRRACHAGVAPMARPAKEIRLVDAEGVERCGQFADAISAELIGGVDGQLGVLSPMTSPSSPRVQVTT